MDPLSILGAAIGVTSLILQVADECVKAFKIYRDAANLPEAHNHLRIRFHLEQQRFLNFALEAGVLYTDNAISSTLQINRSLLLATLAEIKTLLEQYAVKNGKYRKLEASDTVNWDASHDSEPDLLALLCSPINTEAVAGQSTQESGKPDRTKGVRGYRKGVIQTGKNLRSIIMEPRRLIWATVDKAAFEQLISQLDSLNSILIALLDSSQAHKLQETMNATYLEVLQLRSDLGDLTALVGALAVPPSQPTLSLNSALDESNPLFRAIVEEKSVQAKRKSYLKNLAEIKIKVRHSLLEQSESKDLIATSLLSDFASALLPPDNFDFAEAGMDCETLHIRSDATYCGSDVWIEWKSLGTGLLSSSSSALAESRIILLTDLLRFVKPEGFRAPPCIGYVKIVDDDDGTRFGIVFEKPSVTKAKPPTITTLQELIERLPRPSLSARISLCAVLSRCVQSFHAVDWLHKALRPDNIVYCSDPSGLRDPFVTGFDLSRPNVLDEFTEKPSFDPFKDIYRHPNAQSIKTEGAYRRSYDIYSLGVLIIEITQWMPIKDVIGLKNLSQAKPSAMQDVQAALLGETVSSAGFEAAKHCLSYVASACGDVVRGVVQCCLEADKVEHRQYAKESESSTAIRLHTVVEEHIVRKLEQLAKIL